MKKITYAELTFRNAPQLKGKLEKAVIGIAGCGGLGSNAAIALARIGIGKLILVDFDVVEPTNLNRQQYFIDDIGKRKVDALEEKLKMINPFLQIEKHYEKLNGINIKIIFKEAHIVVEAFDQVSEKAMLLKTFSGKLFKAKCLVLASGLAGCGTANTIKTKMLSKNIFVCGDNKTDFLAEGVMAPRVMIAAGHQANKVVEIIDKKF
ncbi:MAG: sulfur carrier protein ThiS adenylyltransferase ThiF [Ignavibacteria bacterium]|nr:sulfur carrier protein ThiS adenylyltransferase ThiF [Ignavibacteria bacterium]NCS82086.1 sulfur carrier protein ThiS adenylyltransferase ThiF [Ignavibacteria bacterium]OIO23559.1 MAG: thiamine biosynthesis protein ThiF [Ignavibacteria bacterium CG1_02_37_35]